MPPLDTTATTHSRGYLAAGLSVAGAGAVSLAARAAGSGAVSLVPFALAAFLSSHFFGLGPGLAATVLSAAWGWQLNPGDWIHVLWLLAAGAVMSVLAERQRVRSHALNASEERCRSLFDSAPHALWTSDARDGTSAGREWLAEVHPDDRAAVERQFDAVQPQAAAWSLEARLRSPGGNYRWVELRAWPNGSGTWCGSATDIERTHAERESLRRDKESLEKTIAALRAEMEQCRETAERLRFAVDSSSAALWDVDLSSGAAVSSPRLAAIMGHTEPALDWSWQRFWAHVHPDDRGLFANAGRGSLPCAPAGEVNCRVRRPDGEVRWVRLSWRTRDSQPPRMLGLIQDLVDARPSGRHTEALYRAVMSSLPDAAVWVVDRQLRYAHVDAELMRQLGIEKTQIEGRTVAEASRLTRPDLSEDFFRQALDGRSQTVESRVGERCYLIHYGPVRAEAEGVVAAIALVLDVTTRKRAEEEAQRLNAELEERVTYRTRQLEAANRELEAFSYSVSHDLRAPLRGIDGWSLAMLEDYDATLDERAHSYLARVRYEAQRMGLLIDDLLRFSRATRGDMQLRPIDLSALASTITATMAEAQPSRQFVFDVEPGLKANGDPRLIEIALTNLFDNAIKFTSRREVAHIAFGSEKRPGGLAYFVRDNGAGFNMAYADKLFGAFQRMHSLSEFPGLGIGLAIVQRVIRRHEGRVWAASAVDAGTTIYFTLGGAE